MNVKSEMEKSGSFASEKLRFSKRSPFTLQKESFYSPKGVLLLIKRSPFTHQKESFCLAHPIFGVILLFWLVQTVGGYGVLAVA